MIRCCSVSQRRILFVITSTSNVRSSVRTTFERAGDLGMAKKRRMDKTEKTLRKVVESIASPEPTKRKKRGEDARTRVVERKIKNLLTREHRRQDRNT